MMMMRDLLLYVVATSDIHPKHLLVGSSNTKAVMDEVVHSLHLTG